MRRYWVPRSAFSGFQIGSQLILEGQILHHIRDVCRQDLGCKFESLVEGGQAFLVEIINESKHRSVAQILEIRNVDAIPRPHIHLAMAIPRFPVFEAVIEKAVELGVFSIHPFFSAHSFIKKQEDIFTKKRDRFEKIVISATQQSGRGELMKVFDPIPIENLLKEFNLDHATAGLFAYEGPSVLTAREGLGEIVKKFASPMNPETLQNIWIFVGAEGGFSQGEVELFQTVGMKSITLGGQVLRVETACVALISIIKYELDLMR